MRRRGMRWWAAVQSAVMEVRASPSPRIATGNKSRSGVWLLVLVRRRCLSARAAPTALPGPERVRGCGEQGSDEFVHVGRHGNVDRCLGKLILGPRVVAWRVVKRYVDEAHRTRRLTQPVVLRENRLQRPRQIGPVERNYHVR